MIKKMLVIDSSIYCLSYYKSILKNKEFDFYETNSCESAIKLILDLDIDLVILDSRFEEIKIDGLIDFIRLQRKQKEICVILISNNNIVNSFHFYNNECINTILFKPVSPANLLNAVVFCEIYGVNNKLIFDTSCKIQSENEQHI